MESMINPGKEWLDTDSIRIEAHGGTIYYENGVYYRLGEDKSHTGKKGKIWTWGMKCYSSTDLVNWKDEGHIIQPEPEDKNSLFFPERRMDRPHLLHNSKTGKYVLWVKYCDGAHYAVLTADTILGPYTVVEPHLQPHGHKSGDFDLALDVATGTAYLYYEADHNSILVTKLNEEFTHETGEPAVIYADQRPPLTREAPAHFIHNGKHYLITSGMTGYVPNPSEVAIADDWMGPFTVLGDPCVDDESSATFNSQVSCVFQTASGQLIMMADRWLPDYIVTRERYEAIARAISAHYDKRVKASFKDFIQMVRAPMGGSADTSRANYVWLPVEFEGDMPRIRWREQWMPDL